MEVRLGRLKKVDLKRRGGCFLLRDGTETDGNLQKTDRRTNVKKLNGVIMGSVILVMVVFGFGDFNSAVSAAPAPIKIGFINHFTGPLTGMGQRMERGARFALEQIGFQIGGRPVVFIVEDDTTDPGVAVDKARKLVMQDKVCVIMGPVAGNVVEAVAQYCGTVKMPNSELSDAYLTNAKYPYHFSPAGSLSQYTYPWGKYCAEKLGYKTAIVVACDYSAGFEKIKNWSIGFKEAGGTIVNEKAPILPPLGTSDFSSYLTAITRYKADVVGVWTPSMDGIRFVKQYGEYGLKEKYPLVGLQGIGLLKEELLAEAGPTILGMMGTKQFVDTRQSKHTQAVVAAYKAKYGMLMGDDAGDAYTSMEMVIAGIKASINDLSGDKLLKAVLNLDMETISGRKRFDKQIRFCIAQPTVVKVEMKGNQYVNTAVDVLPEISPRDVPDFADIQKYLK
jgi:branched-chain amino acid transport system substrate-binding protein